MSTDMPYRPFRETPVATEEDVQRMMERLRRRGKIGKPDVRINAGASPAGVSDGESPRDAEATPSAGGGELPYQASMADLSDSPRPAPLQWERVSPYAMRTLCRTWTCCKVIQSGQVSYELLRTIAGLERPVCVRRGLESFDEAKEIAESEPR